MAEELRLDQLLGNRGAVDFDQGRIGARGETVDRPGDELLARSVLACDQDPGVRRGHAGDFLVEQQHGRRFAEQRRFRLGPAPERFDLGQQVAPLDRLLRGQDDPFQRQGLLQKIVGAQTHGAHRRLDIGVPRDHHDRDLAQPTGRCFQYRKAVEVPQPDVQEGQVEVLFPEPSQSLFAGFDRGDRVPLVSQDLRERLPDGLLVVDDEDATLLHAAGSSMMNRAPRGRFSSTRMVPLWSATMRDTMARPRPVPRPFVVKSGRKSLSRSRAGTPRPVSATSIETPCRVFREADRDLARGAARLERVVEQVDQGPLDLFGIEQDSFAREARLDAQVDPLAGPFEEAHGRARESRQVGRLGPHLRQAREAGELVDEGLQEVHFFHDDFRPALDRLRAGPVRRRAAVWRSVRPRAGWGSAGS